MKWKVEIFEDGKWSIMKGVTTDYAESLVWLERSPHGRATGLRLRLGDPVK